MRIGLRVPPCAPSSEVADFAARAESARFDSVWLPDSQLLWRDVFVAAHACVTGTSHIRIGTAVTNVRTRHPTVVASAARSVAEVAANRFVLGLGAGNSSVRPIGDRPATHDELRSGVSSIRALIAGEPWPFDGVRARMVPRGPRFPIYVAASGPRNLALAGRVADGVIILGGITRELLGKNVGHVRDGVQDADRDLADLEIVIAVTTYLTSRPERDVKMLKPICLALAHAGAHTSLRASGVQLDRLPEQLPAVFPDLLHAQDWDEAIRLAEPHISDDAALRFASDFCLFGSATEIVSKLDRIAEHGVGTVCLQDIRSFELPHDLLDALAGAST